MLVMAPFTEARTSLRSRLSRATAAIGNRLVKGGLGLKLCGQHLLLLLLGTPHRSVSAL